MITETIVLNEIFENVTLKGYIHSYDIERPKPALIICPGGGYISHSDSECDPVALRFLSKGFNTFILKYSVGMGFARFPLPFRDLEKALIYLKDNHARYGIDRDKIALCGFSTGGHIASVIGTMWSHEAFRGNSCRPAAMILAYPLLDIKDFALKHSNSTVEMMLEAIYGSSTPSDADFSSFNPISSVSKYTVPTFVWSTDEDSVTGSEKCLELALQLKRNSVPHEIHIFSCGKHGFGAGDPYVSSGPDGWIELACSWLKKQLDT